MLVLSRQRDETIMIGDDVEITIVDIRGDKVRLGISAPNRIAVHRKEVYEAILEENEQASRLADAAVEPLRVASGVAGRGMSALVSPTPGAPGTAPFEAGSPAAGPPEVQEERRASA